MSAAMERASPRKRRQIKNELEAFADVALPQLDTGSVTPAFAMQADAEKENGPGHMVEADASPDSKFIAQKAVDPVLSALRPKQRKPPEHFFIGTPAIGGSVEVAAAPDAYTPRWYAARDMDQGGLLCRVPSDGLSSTSRGAWSGLEVRQDARFKPSRILAPLLAPPCVQVVAFLTPGSVSPRSPPTVSPRVLPVVLPAHISSKQNGDADASNPPGTSSSAPQYRSTSWSPPHSPRDTDRKEPSVTCGSRMARVEEEEEEEDSVVDLLDEQPVLTELSEDATPFLDHVVGAADAILDFVTFRAWFPLCTRGVFPSLPEERFADEEI